MPGLKPQNQQKNRRRGGSIVRRYLRIVGLQKHPNLMIFVGQETKQGYPIVRRYLRIVCGPQPNRPPLPKDCMWAPT